MGMATKEKSHLMRETESLLTAGQNNATGTKCIKAKIDNTQKNSKKEMKRLILL